MKLSTMDWFSQRLLFYNNVIVKSRLPAFASLGCLLPVLNLPKPTATTFGRCRVYLCSSALTSQLVPHLHKNKPLQLSLQGFVVSPRIELGSSVQETPILSIELRDHRTTGIRVLNRSQRPFKEVKNNYSFLSTHTLSLRLIIML